MAVRIRSLATAMPVVVPLSTGEAVRLSPGELSADLPHVAVANNPKVDKLRERGLITVEAVTETEAEAVPEAEGNPPADSPAEPEDRDGTAVPGPRPKQPAKRTAGQP